MPNSRVGAKAAALVAAMALAAFACAFWGVKGVTSAARWATRARGGAGGASVMQADGASSLHAARTSTATSTARRSLPGGRAGDKRGAFGEVDDMGDGGSEGGRGAGAAGAAGVAALARARAGASEGKGEGEGATDTNNAALQALSEEALERDAWLRALSALVAGARGGAATSFPFRVCVATTVAPDAAAAAREVLPWAAYHRAVGVDEIWLFIDGGTPHDTEAGKRLLQRAEVSGAIVLHDVEGGRRGGNGVAGDALGNHALMEKQGASLRRAIEMAREPLEGSEGGGHSAAQQRCDWLVHVDIDELLLPLPAGAGGGGAAAAAQARRRSAPGRLPLPFSLHAGLAEAHARDEVVQVHVWNHEGKPEGADVRRRFEDVTLFATNGFFRNNNDPRNLGNTPEGLAYKARSNATRAAALAGELAMADVAAASVGTDALGDANRLQMWLEAETQHLERRFAFHLYSNGKPLGRVSEKLVENGPHYFKLYGKLSDGRRTTWDSPDMALLHYPYSLVDEVLEKAERSCALEEGDVSSSLSSATAEAEQGERQESQSQQTRSSSFSSAARRCFIYRMERELWVSVNEGLTDAARRARAEKFYTQRLVLHTNLTGGADDHAVNGITADKYALELRRGRLARIYEAQTLQRWLRRLGGGGGSEAAVARRTRCAARLLAALAAPGEVSADGVSWLTDPFRAGGPLEACGGGA